MAETNPPREAENMESPMKVISSPVGLVVFKFSANISRLSTGVGLGLGVVEVGLGGRGYLGFLAIEFVCLLDGYLSL